MEVSRVCFLQQSESPGAIKEPLGRQTPADAADHQSRSKWATGQTILLHQDLKQASDPVNSLRAGDSRGVGQFQIGQRLLLLRRLIENRRHSVQARPPFIFA
ncbi:MAG: hypothetical protein V2J42_00330 [Wenzhouxiangella sp.]|nr:hypothetical protein [Wenzhouxiangella sp.]